MNMHNYELKVNCKNRYGRARLRRFVTFSPVEVVLAGRNHAYVGDRQDLLADDLS